MTVGEEWFDAMLNPACTTEPAASTADITVSAQPDNKHGLSAAQMSEALRRDLLIRRARSPTGSAMSVMPGRMAGSTMAEPYPSVVHSIKLSMTPPPLVCDLQRVASGCNSCEPCTLAVRLTRPDTLLTMK
ncbi:hypothetical protein BSU04_33080 [Caballeronia sordidicola]|uniref:Uncharacterized protein n=1 Tax=Caballeronia sordidicola TaxID=196367 RepID=A0A226WTR8_CABSO|nr:hypothetical protein BSU04_33080 [Caballeronia sordidicola]